MNDRIYEICSSLTDDVLQKDMGLFFGSIHKTLDHILYGDIAWLLRFEKKENQVPELNQLLYSDFIELTKQRKEWDAKIINWADSVNDTWLLRDFTYSSKVDGKQRIKKAWLLATHMFNHQTHHRGQLTTALNQIGYDCGVTDLPFLLAE